MPKDIHGKKDLMSLVTLFYEKLLQDELIGHFFVKFKDNDVLAPHLDALVSFWENILFYSGGYRKNVMEIHQGIHRQSVISESHVNRWLSVFNESVDELFEGENATAVKSRAASIAIVMKIKFSKDN